MDKLKNEKTSATVKILHETKYRKNVLKLKGFKISAEMKKRKSEVNQLATVKILRETKYRKGKVNVKGFKIL